ncbi:MarR family winged helix-turn-helix transcriptional regulator [Cellulosimicrobium marinum]|uniref:MarR family winged helix-turn-helix transcriptional regulator n=1 Tax=Cellulosimicrobium marinum TaxID=1638992 RepID=UPI001E59B52F|nr:MarR family transcriptional regulator [Cellulosimicrobium marinum]MCB7135232.1 MarR family transcriptional regulator [Cellulosimicrobium marinum]
MPVTPTLVPDDAPPASPGRTPTTALVRALDDLARVQKESAARLARELDVPRAALGVLRMLDRCGTVQLGDVAGRLRVDLSVASRQVSHLVDAGLAHRTVDDDDRRARTVELTDAGREVVRHSGALVEAMGAEVFADWTPTEIHAATEQIERVTAAVTAAHALPAPLPAPTPATTG